MEGFSCGGERGRHGSATASDGAGAVVRALYSHQSRAICALAAFAQWYHTNKTFIQCINISAKLLFADYSVNYIPWIVINECGQVIYLTGNNFSLTTVSINCFMACTVRLLLCALPLISYSPVSTPLRLDCEMWQKIAMSIHGLRTPGL